MKHIILSLSVFVSFASFAQDYRGRIFDDKVCTSGEIMTQSMAIEIVGAGNSETYIGYSHVFERSRKCNTVTGCGAWGPIKKLDKIVEASFGVQGHRIGAFFVDNSGHKLSLGWTSPHADGRVNGCRGGSEIFGEDSYCTLYLRSNCMKLKLESIKGDRQYMTYWKLK